MSTSRMLTQSVMSPPTAPGPQPPAGEGFVAGTMLAGRFRIVGLLGRGGMGEVYRAEDLTLQQAVALKFLPAAMAEDPNHRARMLEEVRAARQVTHPNVCRVHDLMEAEGRHFLAMELITGEDLGSLLRRVGRLTPGKGLQIARQIAAALAAVHARGILHRDLKPANVMIDDQGEVKLTDFGLAIPTSGSGQAGLAGTPAYMAGELLTGGKPSVQSDLYALGLVLYELFTGQRAFDGCVSAEHPKRSPGEGPRPPLDLVPDLAPEVSGTILWCLTQEPARRPPSALAVLGALPGGNPLAALVAAGETPSPQVVADAGGEVSLRPARAWLCMALLAVVMPLTVWMAHRASVLRHVDLAKSPEVLAERARQVLAKLEHRAPQRDSASRLQYVSQVRQDLLRDASPGRLATLDGAILPLMEFQYRVASEALRPQNIYSMVDQDEPAPIRPGMATVRLDMRGRLRHFLAVPPSRLEGTSHPMDWRAVLAEAGLDGEPLQTVPPLMTPPVHTTSTTAWTLGTLRFEAGERQGRLVWFATLPDPVQATPQASGGAPPWMRSMRDLPFLVIALALPGISLALAARNWRRRRVDLQGANRLGGILFAYWIICFVSEAHHGGGLDREVLILQHAARWSLFEAVRAWLGYLAMEPFLRRRWPDALISWTRVMTGRWRDPRVGRDLLIGLTVGWGAAALLPLGRLVTGHPFFSMHPPADGTAAALVRSLEALPLAVFYGTIAGVLLTFFRGRLALAVPLVVGICSVVGVAGLRHANPIPMDYLVCGLWALMAVGVLVRLGLFAMMAFLIPLMASGYPLRADLGAWPALYTHGFLLLTGSLALLGLFTSVGRQPLFGTMDDA